ncbi:MAG: acetate/propionate family kinase [Candidatus Jordarchaeaceae archaeon]
MILVLNVGSSTIKFRVFRAEVEVDGGLIDRIGDKPAFVQGGVEKPIDISTHEEGIKFIKKYLEERNLLIEAIGHRVVHGLDISESKVIDEKVLEKIRIAAPLAPLHNPPQLAVIKACESFMVPQIAVFDTSFHQTLPEAAYTYALPKEIMEKYSIRRYGFHGISHMYVSLNEAGRVISCHLGNGVSLAAIRDGKCVDTSMGFTPLEGLVMGSRSGDLDPGILLFLMSKGFTYQELDDMLNRRSGLLGLSGESNDIRELIRSNKKEAKLAIDVFVYRLIKYIGAYVSVLGGLDTLIFTGGIGENEWRIRKRVVEALSYLGAELNEEDNILNREIISSRESRVLVKVKKTNEELMIAREVYKLIGGSL